MDSQFQLYIVGEGWEDTVPLWIVKHYLSRASFHRPVSWQLIVSTASVIKEISRNMISFWLRELSTACTDLHQVSTVRLQGCGPMSCVALHWAFFSCWFSLAINLLKNEPFASLKEGGNDNRTSMMVFGCLTARVWSCAHILWIFLIFGLLSFMSAKWFLLEGTCLRAFCAKAWVQGIEGHW